ncbi:helix-turn-helix domain-containing protein [Streptomyces sp. NPDC093544]|uniref:TetR/AcrR family transcriptional regulator n=1 Tax=Streptomyces sp. NPDC093544 TaxID=3155200 RepID=UPI00342761F8
MPQSQPAPPASLDQDWSERRADARRNHERIIAAALEVFSERGLAATVPEVANRAGVGKATVYRSFATKADLIEAVADYQLRWMEQRVVQALAESDAYQALADFTGDVAERLAGDRVLADVVPTIFQARNRSIRAHLNGLVTAAREQGGIGPEVTVEDLQILFGGYIRQLVAMEIRDPAVWRRYSELVLKALST